MKCNDFEFEYTVAPKEIGGEASEHLESCASCQSFVEKQVSFEGQLAGVINVDVPEGLRNSLREHVASHKPAFWNTPKASLALAASLLIAVGIVSVNLMPSNNATLPIDQLIVEHIAHDGAHSMEVSDQMAPQLLASVSEKFGVRVKLTNHVSFAEKCPIGDTYGLHMVYQINNQPITVIYMPEVTLEKTLPFSYAGLHGWIKPLKTGSMAVLSGSTIELPKEEFADNAIEWL